MTAKQILVVDDEPGITRLCERLLKRAGFSVATQTDPLAAVEYAQQEPIDLLLVDIRMPGMSGFDLLSRVRELQPDAAILVMTGFGTVEMAVQAMRQGVDGLILKPFEKTDELVQSVTQVLSDSQKKRDVARSLAIRPLFDISETLLAETRLEPLLDLILNAVTGSLRCDFAALLQGGEEQAGLIVVTERGRALSLDKRTPAILEKVEVGGLPLLVNASGPGETGLQQEVRQAGLSSMMITPLSRQKFHGLLAVARRAGEAPFREVDWEMFLLLTRQAAVAMENARLYAELRTYVRQVEDSQQALVRAEKMAAVGRMTASIAHEVSNPLQAVQNCLHLAARPEAPDLKRQEYLDMAQIELDRLMQTVQRMLDIFRPSGSNPERIDIASMLRRVIGLLSSQLDERGIRVSAGISSRLPPILVVGDQIQQVFINLVLNAYDAMPQGGELRINARLAREMVEIVFHDSGPGVPAGDRTRIFEPFYSRKEQGTGLGLSISYGIVVAHGGSLDLLYDRGPGACFRVLLPAKRENNP
ncbi:MAG: response regulator [Chloroflexi bacterium]|nr:response regulator [Chloroflexota bacterium]